MNKWVVEWEDNNSLLMLRSFRLTFDCRTCHLAIKFVSQKHTAISLELIPLPLTLHLSYMAISIYGQTSR